MKQLVKKLSNILQVMFHYLFESHHSDLSRVFTIKHRTYQVCLECGCPASTILSPQRQLDFPTSVIRSFPLFLA